MSEWDSPDRVDIIMSSRPPQMRAEVRKLWVAALRSGAYQQGFSRLRSDDDCYCALGVLADIGVKLGVTTWESVTDEEAVITDFFLPGANPSNVNMPILEWAGAKGMFPSYAFPVNWEQDGEGNKVWQPMFRVNDHFRFPFNTIADMIEATY